MIRYMIVNRRQNKRYCKGGTFSSTEGAYRQATRLRLAYPAERNDIVIVPSNNEWDENLKTWTFPGRHIGRKGIVRLRQ